MNGFNRNAILSACSSHWIMTTGDKITLKLFDNRFSSNRIKTKER